MFYIGGVFVIGLLVPSNNPLLNLDSSNASASPFVIAFNEAGIKILPSVRRTSETLASSFYFFIDYQRCSFNRRLVCWFK